MSYEELLSVVASINEDTTMANVAFLPSGFGTVKAQLATLSKKKKSWKIEILEDDDGHTVNFEEDLSIRVAHEHWDEFVDVMFDGVEHMNRYYRGELMNIPLFEDREFDIASTRLQDAVVDAFDEPPVEEVDDDVLKFKNLFGIRDYGQVDALIDYHNKEDDLYGMLEKLKSAYRDDSGYLEMIAKAFDDKRPLNTFKVFRAHSLLYGVSVRTNYGKLNIRFEAFVSNSFDITERFIVDDADILDAIESNVANIKVKGQRIYPRGRRFEKSFFLSVKDIIDSGTVFQEDYAQGDVE